MAYISAVSSQIAEPRSIVARSLAKWGLWITAREERISVGSNPDALWIVVCIYSLDWAPPLRAHLPQRNNMVTS